MVVKVSKPEINVREKISELDKPSGIAGEAMLRADTHQEQFNLIGAGRRNMLINSNFNINQRGTASTITVSDSDNQQYIVDRWRSYALGTTCDVSVQEVVLPNGHKVKSIKTTSNGNATWLHPFQTVEAEDWMAGRIVTLSAWVRTSFPGQKFRICDTVSCYRIGEEIPADGQWHYITASHRMPDTISGPHIQYHPGFQAPAGAGDYQEFACPQIELGLVATPFEYRSYGEELALCQRYYEVIRQNQFLGGDGYNTINSGTSNGTYVFTAWNFKVVKRASPSLGVGNNAKFRAFGNGSSTNLSINEFYSPGPEAARLRVSANFNAGESVMFEFDAANSTNGFVYADAEVS